MVTLLSKILNYEEDVFNEYQLKRNHFIENLKKINTNKLSKQQLLIFINDIKNIIDPLKSSMESIDYHFTNLKFEKTYEDQLTSYLFLGYFLTLISSISSDSELIELSVSESELIELSESLSEPLSESV